MKWISLISGLVGLFRAVFDYFQRKQMIELGSDRAIIEGHQEGDRAIEDAQRARDDARGTPPDKLRDDDGFRRD